MASSDATAIPIKNQAYRITFPILDADGDLVTGATGLDSEVSKDGDTFADCTNEATEIATNSGMYFLDLTQTEMNADTVAIIVKTSSSGAKTTPIVLYPAEAADIIVNVKKINGTDQTAGDVTALINTVDDLLDTEIAAIKAKTDNLPSDPADASVVAGLISAVEMKVDTLDTVADAIKVTTDKLDDTLEDDGGTYRFTENALEEGPGGGTGLTADETAAAVWDAKVDTYQADRSFGSKIGLYLPVISPDIDYKRIKKVVKEEVQAIPKVEIKEPDLTPIVDGLQALLAEIRAIELPEIPKTDFSPIQRQIKALQRTTESIIIPVTDLTETNKLIQARNEVLDQLSEVQEEIKRFHLEDVRELLEDGVEKIKQAVQSMNNKFDNTQMVVLKNEVNKQEPKPSVLEEYLKL